MCKIVREVEYKFLKKKAVVAHEKMSGSLSMLTLQSGYVIKAVIHI